MAPISDLKRYSNSVSLASINTQLILNSKLYQAASTPTRNGKWEIRTSLPGECKFCGNDPDYYSLKISLKSSLWSELTNKFTPDALSATAEKSL